VNSCLRFYGDNFPGVASSSVAMVAAKTTEHHTDLDEGGTVGLNSGITLAEARDNLCCTQLYAGFIGLGTTEQALYHFLDAIELTEALVVEHELGGFVIGEPIALASLDLSQELSIELGIVDG